MTSMECAAIAAAVSAAAVSATRSCPTCGTNLTTSRFNLDLEVEFCPSTDCLFPFDQPDFSGRYLRKRTDDLSASFSARALDIANMYFGSVLRSSCSASTENEGNNRRSKRKRVKSSNNGAIGKVTSTSGSASEPMITLQSLCEPSLQSRSPSIGSSASSLQNIKRRRLDEQSVEASRAEPVSMPITRDSARKEQPNVNLANTDITDLSSLLSLSCNSTITSAPSQLSSSAQQSSETQARLTTDEAFAQLLADFGNPLSTTTATTTAGSAIMTPPTDAASPAELPPFSLEDLLSMPVLNPQETSTASNSSSAIKDTSAQWADFDIFKSLPSPKLSDCGLSTSVSRQSTTVPNCFDELFSMLQSPIPSTTINMAN